MSQNIITWLLNASADQLIVLFVWIVVAFVVGGFYIITLAMTLHAELLEVVVKKGKISDLTWVSLVHFVLIFVAVRGGVWILSSFPSSVLQVVMVFLWGITFVFIHLYLLGWLERDSKRAYREYRYTIWNQPWSFPFSVKKERDE